MRILKYDCVIYVLMASLKNDRRRSNTAQDLMLFSEPKYGWLTNNGIGGDLLWHAHAIQYRGG
ncbi:MAG: hypothetical protein B0D91_11855 [Oceanospirillales bacterium LUC14_002_19_P2]|nr:MAG: hypothetical protein B0D91_11855 [Oceanospirillales bacterium LUC14_002_19_P2]